MNLKNEKLCRICLNDNVFFDWIEAIFEFSGPSYKECYYQYTHLQDEVEDPFSTMLCFDCARGLRNTYELVEKALASDKKLKKYKSCADPFKECHIEHETLPDTIDLLIENSNEPELKKSLTEVLILSTHSEDDVQTLEEQNLEKSSNNIEIINTRTKEKVRNVNSIFSNKQSTYLSKSDRTQRKPRKQYKGLPLMCVYCSKIIYSPGRLKLHERTHENRERTEACPNCGLKFFDKHSLKIHMEIHTENRQRRYKCEFCTKAFFNPGGLTIHKRIHLGQMLKCKLCSKEYSRQLDLDRHMHSHDTARIAADIERKPRVYNTIYMDCKTCGKKVAWESWESHKARHLNQPLFQCSICNKDYYTRKPITSHLKQMHNISGRQYEKFIIRLNKKFKPRLSSLMKQQNILLE